MSQFHGKHGRSIDVDKDGRTAKKRKRIGSNWVYSKRDVKANEVVCIRVSGLTSKESKRPFVMAFTDEDPQNMPMRPKTTWHLCNGKMSLATYECREGALIQLIYDQEKRLVFMGVDGQLRGVTTLFGLRDAPRWLAVRMDGKVGEIQMYESPERQWDSFVLEATRIAKIFEDVRVFNRGAPGLPKPQLGFDKRMDPRVQYSDGDRIANIQGNTADGLNLYANRQILLGEVVSIKLSRVVFGTTLEISAVSEDPTAHQPQYGHDQPIIIQLTHDEVVRVLATETGLLIQGLRRFVQNSARFYPVSPLWLRLNIRSPATFLNVEFEDPHKLPPSSSLRGSELIVKNRTFSSMDREHSMMCKICFNRKVDTALSPCHHVSMCSDCTRKVMERVNWKCPVCGEDVSGVFSINVV